MRTGLPLSPRHGTGGTAGATTLARRERSRREPGRRDRVHAKGITRPAGHELWKQSRQTGAGSLLGRDSYRRVAIPHMAEAGLSPWPQGRPTPSEKAIARRWLSASSCITTAQPGRTNRPPRPARPLLAWLCNHELRRRGVIPIRRERSRRAPWQDDRVCGNAIVGAGQRAQKNTVKRGLPAENPRPTRADHVAG